MMDKGLYTYDDASGYSYAVRQKPLTDLEPLCKHKGLGFPEALIFLMEGKLVIRDSAQGVCYGLDGGVIIIMARTDDKTKWRCGPAKFDSDAILAQDWMVMP